MTDRQKVAARIARYTLKGEPNDCWNWSGTKRPTTTPGVYRAVAAGFNGKPKTAARVIWQIERGDIPASLCVLHTCDNAMCVNPRHLYLGTALQNQADRVARQRLPTVLTVEIVRKIVDLRSGGTRNKDIAKQLSLTDKHVSEVLRGRSWRHVTGIDPSGSRARGQHVESLLPPEMRPTPRPPFVRLTRAALTPEGQKVDAK